MSWCLLPKLADNFKREILDGTVHPEKLNEMTSRERHDFFSERFGEKNATEINSLFESKLLLKNQQLGMISWANSLIGTPKEVRRDLVSRIRKMDRVLDAETEDAFLSDLAKKKIGVGVSFEEATKLTELSSEISKASEKDQAVRENRIEYGNKILEMEEYLAELMPKLKNIIVNLLNLPRTLMTAVDLSAPFNQGFGLVLTKEFRASFREMHKMFATEKAYRDVMADIITRPTFDKMKSSGLRITKLTDKLEQREEAMMSSLLDKLPVLRGSMRAYTGFLNKLRAYRFDTLHRAAEMAGEDVSRGSKALSDISEVINNFTGSGNMGKGDRFAGAVPLLNNIFFSPRKIASTINMLNPAKYVKLSPEIRRAAISQLVGSTITSATVLSLAAMAGYEVEKDPRSADFGKVQVGNTRIDVTGGNSSYLTLLARLYSNSSKSTMTDIVSGFGTGFGETSRGDIFGKYFRNKLSPVASFVADWLYGKNTIGEPFEMDKELVDRAIPMSIGAIMETLKDDPKMALPLGFMSLYLQTNTYSTDVSWENSMTAELTQLKEKVGDEKFNEANDSYNAKFREEISRLKKDEDFLGLSEEDKSKTVDKMKKDIKSSVFKEYGFKYKK